MALSPNAMSAIPPAAAKTTDMSGGMVKGFLRAQTVCRPLGCSREEWIYRCGCPPTYVTAVVMLTEEPHVISLPCLQGQILSMTRLRMLFQVGEAGQDGVSFKMDLACTAF